MVSKIKSWKRFLSSKWQSIHLDYPVEFRPRHAPASDTGLSEINKLLHSQAQDFKLKAELIRSYETDLVQFKKRSEEPNALMPGWNNGYLPGLDMAALFAFVSEFQPKRYVEVGSGNSTLVAAAAKSQHSPLTEITSIDPFPNWQQGGKTVINVSRCGRSQGHGGCLEDAVHAGRADRGRVGSF